MSLMVDFKSPCGQYVLVFEDDGKVAYGYLKDLRIRQGDPIVGEVWLYNRSQTPAEPEWTDRTKIPFANSSEYISDGGRLGKLVHPDDIRVTWEDDEHGPIAYVYIYDDLFGVVGVGDRPGYARHATKSNRLARVMQIDDEDASSI